MASAVPVIHTARLTLRPLRVDDADRAARELGNYDVVRWLASVPYPYHFDDALTFIGEAARQTDPVWAIDDDRGFCGVVAIDPDLGYWLARPAWGQGYITEAGDAVVDAYFARRRNKVLRGSYMEGNERSRAVLIKLGFVPDGSMTIRSLALGQDVPGHAMFLDRARWRTRRRYRLATSRLRLRELRDGDLSSLRRIAQDARIAPMLLGVPNLWPVVDARRWLRAFRYRGRPGFWAAICTRAGRLIGTAFMGPPPGGGDHTCAWFLDPAYWGRGLATEAVAAFLADTMDRFSVETLHAEQFSDNCRSAAMMGRLGFVENGRGDGSSAARLETAEIVIYRLERSQLKAPK